MNTHDRLTGSPDGSCRHRRGPSRRAVLSGALGAGLVVGLLGTRAPAAAAGTGNLVPNAGFEEVSGSLPARWRPFSAASATSAVVSEDRVRSGRRSLSIDDASSSLGVGMRSEEVTAIPGWMYEASVFAYVEAGQASLYLEFWDGGGAAPRSSSASAPSSGPGSGSTWGPWRRTTPSVSPCSCTRRPPTRGRPTTTTSPCSRRRV